MLHVAVIFCSLNIKFWSEFAMSSPYCLCKQYKTSLLRDDYWSLLVTVQTLQGLSCWEINKLHKSIPDDTFFINNHSFNQGFVFWNSLFICLSTLSVAPYILIIRLFSNFAHCKPKKKSGNTLWVDKQSQLFQKKLNLPPLDVAFFCVSQCWPEVINRIENPNWPDLLHAFLSEVDFRKNSPTQIFSVT